jgi:hypothetical protein
METPMSRWRARSTAPEGTPILVRYKDEWRGANFRETFEAEFSGNTCWRRNYSPRDFDKPHNLRTRNGNTQKYVYENGTRCAIVGWRHLPSNG